MPAIDTSLFNILVSILILVFGFLLNRVFSELDKINAANAKLREELPKEYFTQTAFFRHKAEETRLFETMMRDISKRFDKIDILLEAVRVKQQQ